MLRRRIFSSAMASVMALSSIAVVAQAEETTNQVVTEEQLKELVEVTFGADYRADELENYGKTSADAMLDALEAAEAILDDSEADEEDYTVAYQMVMACEKRLTQHTLEELKALLEDCKAELATNNIFNEELMDQRYDPGKFAELESEVEEAESYLTSTSAGDIADAFDALEYDYNELLKSALPKVSKSDFRSVLKQYEAIIADEFAYDSWRRGAIGWAEFSYASGWSNTGSFKGSASAGAFGAFYDYCKELKGDINTAYDRIDEIKGLTITTDGDIVDEYNRACDIVKMYNAWSADSSSRATKSGVKALLDEYHGQLVYEYNRTSVDELVTAITGISYEETLISTTTFEVATNYVNGTMKIGFDSATPADGYYLDWDGNVHYLENIIVSASDSTGTTFTADGYAVDADDTIQLLNGKDWDWSGYKGAQEFYAEDGETLCKYAGLITYKNLDTPTDYDDGILIVERYQVLPVGTPTGTKIEGGWNAPVGTVDNISWGTTSRLVGADYKIKPTTSNLYIPLDKDGYWDPTKAIETDKDGRKDGIKYQTIAKNSKFDLAQLIPVTSDMVEGNDEYYTHHGDGTTTVIAGNNIIDSMDEIGDYIYTNTATKTYGISLADALAIAEDYLAGEWKDSAIKSIDDTGVIATGKEPEGKSSEWKLVYRALEYALTDRYEGTVKTEFYSKADVKDLIEDAYQLVEDTGDASIFNVSNVALVNARQAAIAWVAQAESDKLYKDGNPGKDADDKEYVSSTAAYKALWGSYEQLQKEFNALKYSFGDIYDTLADTADRIDDGELAATDELLAAMDEVAYRLSIMPAITDTSADEEYTENYAFDVDRVFNANNRLVTNAVDPNTTYAHVNIKTIAEELGVDSAAVYCWSWGDNTAHYNLLNAFNALNDAIAAQAEPEVLLGDANGDGAVTAADAAAILKSAVGLAEVDAAAADYNGDGAVTAADASAILKALVS